MANLEIPDAIKSILDKIPHNPGVYQYYNSDNVIIYVGKAKDLKKRVSSYFNRDAYDNGKLRILVSKICDIQYIVVDTESDALLLENNLIKKYQPRYNILLKDDKTFPWIAIKDEFFPRIISTRNYIDDGSIYYGPYTSGLMVKTLLSLVKKLYPLRTCSLDLNPEKIKKSKYKPCLEFHVGNCKGPCIGKQELDEYNRNILSIKEILKGNISDIQKYLKELMLQYAASLDYENASIVKDKIEILKNYSSKSTIVNPDISNIDVFSIVEKGDDVAVNFLRVINGAIVQVHSVDAKRKLNESLEEVLSIAITEIRQKMLSSSKEIVVSVMPDIKMDGIKYTIPKIGDKLKLLELSRRNAQLFLMDRLKQNAEKSEKFKERKDSVLERMKTELKLDRAPLHIECFDNSNLQGTNPVASCVVFKNAKPARSEYRHFNIKTVIGPDDFASMREIVFRRYKRRMNENLPLPDLIVVDGGKGQLSAAIESLNELGLMDKVQLIGIAKKLEEIFKPGDPVPLYVDKSSPSLKIIQHIRNEAHRFGITFHRDKRSLEFTKSALDDLKGIGEKAKDQLFKHFKSIEAIKMASINDLSEIIGKSKAEIVFLHFNS